MLLNADLILKDIKGESVWYINDHTMWLYMVGSSFYF